MDTLKFITDCLAQTHLRLAATCDGLTGAQMIWRPAPTANNIGFILWHVSRNEDSRITAAARQPAGASAPFAADLWVADGWHVQFGQPPHAPDPGDRQGLRPTAHPPARRPAGLRRSRPPPDGTVPLRPTLHRPGYPHRPRPAGPDRRRLPAPPDSPQKQPPRPNRLPPRATRIRLGPAPRRRRHPAAVLARGW